MIESDRAIIEAMEKSGVKWLVEFAFRYTQSSDDRRTKMRKSNSWLEYIDLATPAKPHVHAESMLEYAKDWAETEKPWNRWRRRCSDDQNWFTCRNHPKWVEDHQYERIPAPPKTISINRFDVPEPVRKELNIFDNYYTFDCDTVFQQAWLSDTYPSHLKRLKAGVIHLTKESAEIHRKALLSFTAKEEAQ